MSNNEILVSGIPVKVHASMDDAVKSVFSSTGDEIVSGVAIAINPEKVMKARNDRKVMEALLSATFLFADGIGVVWALRSKGAKQAARIPGCELWVALMKEAGRLKQPVFLVGAKQDVLNQVHEKLVAEFGVNVVGKQNGFFSDLQQDDLIQCIRASGAKLVTVAMGSPKQELFINRCRQSCPDAFYMGVGGTYDVFSGNVNRASAWVCKLNLEWLHRLLSNPSRLWRQVVLAKYLWLLLTKKI